MPPRWLSVGILVSWLAAMGWLFWHDLWPSWRPGEPPGFSIDLVEEVGRNNDRDRLRTYWNVQHQKMGAAAPTDVFRAETWVDYRQEDDTFALHAKWKVKTKAKTKEKATEKEKEEKDDLEFHGFKVESMTSKYRVNRAGQLRELWCEMSLQKFDDNEEMSNAPIIQFTLRGVVHDDRFHAHCRAEGLLRGELDLPPTPVSRNASVLLPLHPVNRIHGLRPGQRWRQPLIDPIRDAFGSLFGGGSVHYLNARVLPQPQVLQEGDNDNTTCLVIEYTDEDGQEAGRTWVEQVSERVQQQEAVLDGDRWIMKRDNPRRATKPPIFPGR